MGTQVCLIIRVKWLATHLTWATYRATTDLLPVLYSIPSHHKEDSHRLWCVLWKEKETDEWWILWHIGDVNLKINFMMDVLDFLPLESPKPSSSAILGWEARFLDALTAASSAKTTSSTACESSASSSWVSTFPFPLLWSEEADGAPSVPFCSTGFLAKISSISLADFFLLKMSSISVDAFGWLVEAVET